MAGSIAHFKGSRLRVEGEIGSGGFGAIFKAWSEKHQKHFAVKCLLNCRNLPPSEAKELRKEAELQYAARHENICLFWGVCMERELYGLVMEYYRIGSLKRALQSVDFPWELRWRVVSEIAAAVNFLHVQNPQIIHGDLKAENILLNDDCRVKICDFGLSSWRRVSKTTSQLSHAKGGTITHIPPECIKDISYPPSTKYDIYSFAILLWEIALPQKRLYEHARNHEQIRQCITLGNRPDMTQFPSELAEEYKIPLWRDIMQRCWQHNPKARPEVKEILAEVRCMDGIIEGARQASVNVVQELRAQEELLERFSGMTLTDAVSDRGSVRESSAQQPSFDITDAIIDRGSVRESSAQQPAFDITDAIIDRGSVQESSAQQQAITDAVVDQGNEQESSTQQPMSTDTQTTKVGTQVVNEESSKDSSTHLKQRCVPSGSSVREGDMLDGGEPPSVVTDASPMDTEETSSMQETGQDPEGALYHDSENGGPQEAHGPENSRPHGEPSAQEATPKLPKETANNTEKQQEWKNAHVFIGNNIHIGHIYYGAGPMGNKAEGNGSLPGHPQLREMPPEPKEPKKQLESQHFIPLSRLITGNWKSLGKTLGLEDGEIGCIDYDYERDGLQEKIYQMIAKWCSKYGKRATVGKFVKACNYNLMYKASDYLCDT